MRVLGWVVGVLGALAGLLLAAMAAAAAWWSSAFEGPGWDGETIAFALAGLGAAAVSIMLGRLIARGSRAALFVVAGVAGFLLFAVVLNAILEATSR